MSAAEVAPGPGWAQLLTQLEASPSEEQRHKTPRPQHPLGGFPVIPLVMEAEGLEWNP